MSAVLQIIIYTRKLLVRETRDTDFSYNLFNGSKTTANISKSALLKSSIENVDSVDDLFYCSVSSQRSSMKFS